MAQSLDKYGYLKASPLSPKLLEHVIIWLDEGLYHRALNVLSASALSKSGFAKPQSDGHALVPGSHFLALLATLTVHPYTTTYRNSNDDDKVSDKALDILYNINRLVGPINAGFQKAFVFSKQAGLGGKRGSNKRQRLRDAQDDDDQPETQVSDDPGPLFEHRMAQEGSLFEKSDDFWRVLGWSLNCAALHPKRWVFWKQWLEFQLGVLEDDWLLRVNMWIDAGNKEDTDRAVLRDSIIMQYLRGAGAREGRNFRRRIFRSIFAHGEASAVQEFQMIFELELKERQKAPARPFGKRKQVNLDEDMDEFGDYYDPIDQVEVEIKNQDGTRRRISARKWDQVLDNGDTIDEEQDDRPPVAMWGSVDALKIRQRVLVLLSEVSRCLPAAFVSLDDLMIDYTEFIKPLPPPIFSFFTRPPPSRPTQGAEPGRLPLAAQEPVVGDSYSSKIYVLLLRTILHALTGKGPSATELLSSGAVPSVRDLISEKGGILEYKATTQALVDNAKVSYLIECLLRVLLYNNPSLGRDVDSQSSQVVADDTLLGDQEILAAVEWGIEVRKFKTNNSKLKASEQEASQWLLDSAAQLGLIGRLITGTLSASRIGRDRDTTPKAKTSGSFDLGTSSPLSSVPTSSRLNSRLYPSSP